MLKHRLILVFIVFMAVLLRFWQLGQNPPSLDWDETAHGYNAYSILKTGHDEYGLKFPLYFRSFDDYKPPLYTYLVVSSVAIFGLNDFAVRFPSAFLGVLAVIFTYFMVKELFAERYHRYEKYGRYEKQSLVSLNLTSRTSGTSRTFVTSESIALLAAFFLAISPWHLQFSRVAFETNSATFWSVLGTWAFLRGVKTQESKLTLWMGLAAVAFGVNLFMYHNARVFVPIFSLALLLLYRDKLLSVKKFLIAPAIVAIIFVAVLIPILFSTAGQLRFKGTTIFADASPQYKAAQLIAQDEQANQLTIGRILHNRRFAYIPILVDNYLSHFRFDFLFFEADMDRHHAPEMGLLYLWDLPFTFAGIYFLIRKNFEFKSKIIIFWWFLIAPVASSVTWGVPHSLRSEIYLPTFQIFIAIGVYYFYKTIKNSKLSANFSFSLPAIATATAGLLTFNFLFYLHQYYVHMPIEYSKAWLYGRRQAALFTESIKDSYNRVIVSTKVDQPHEFWLYYLAYDPQKYLAEGGTISGGFLEDRNKFDKYFFKPIDYHKQREETKTLFVGLPSEFPTNANVLKIIHYLNGEEALYIVGE